MANDPSGSPQTLVDTDAPVTGRSDGDAARADAAGSTIGRYVLLSKLGAGAMGVVFAAYDPKLDRKIALKLLRARGSAAHRQRLEREAQAMARLTHPNVLTVHDVGVDADELFVAMEFVDGRTLRQWTKETPRSWPEIVDVFSRAGRGLLAAHLAGLVHRDFKPDNVMVADDGRVLVMDFGLVRATATEEIAEVPLAAVAVEDSREAPLTMTGAVLGTPAYMAPEQHLGTDVDARTDQFAFCVALWEALYGQRPFAGENVASLAMKVTSGEMSSPPASTEVPRWIRRILERGLQARRDARYPSMAELLDELGRDPRRRRWWMLGGGAAVVLTLGGVAKYHAQAEARRAECEARASEIEAQWNPARRDAVDRAFRATAQPYALDALSRVNDRLDTLADDWSDSAHTWCSADDEPVELVSEADRCLDEAAARVGAIVDVLEQADAKVVQRVVIGVQKLAPVERCNDRTWLAQRTPPPSDPDTRERLAELQRQVARLVALDAIGRYAEILPLAEEIRPDVEALGWAPLRADLEYRTAMAQERLGQFDAARDSLMRAFELSLASGNDEIAAQSSALLVTVLGSRLGDQAAGLRWAGVARALLERTGRDDELIAAHTANTIGALLLDAGRYDEAYEELTRSLELRERWLGPDHVGVAQSLNNLGAIHWVRQDYDACREVNERALQLRRSALGDHHPDVASSYSNLGGVLLIRGEHEAALANFTRALEIWEEAYGDIHPMIAAALTNMAATLERTSEPELALPLLLRALAILQATGGIDHPETARLLVAIAENLERTEHDDAAIVQARRALAIREAALDETHPSVAATHFVLGRLLQRNGASGEALEHLQLALARQQDAETPPLDLAKTKAWTARALWDAGGDRARARSLMTDAHAAFVEVGDLAEGRTDAAARWLHAHPVEGPASASDIPPS